MAGIPLGDEYHRLTTSGLAVPRHDYVANTYTDGNLTSTVFKLGGSGGDTVATLTYTYDGDGNVLTVTRS